MIMNDKDECNDSTPLQSEATGPALFNIPTSNNPVDCTKNGLAGQEHQRAALLSSEWKWKYNMDENAKWETEMVDNVVASLLDSMKEDKENIMVSSLNNDDVRAENVADNKEDTNDSYHNEGFKYSPVNSTVSFDNDSDVTDDKPLIKITDYDDNEPELVLASQTSQKTSGTYELLPSLQDDNILSFTIEEIDPRLIPTIANKLTIADEHFLASSQHSIASSRKNGMRSNTMQNIHEKGSFLSLTSNGRLGKAMHKALLHLKDEKAFSSLMAINKEGMKELEENDRFSEAGETSIVKSKKYTKNVYIISLCVMLNFIALGSVRNLQSSINHEGGIGVISMTISFVGYMFASIFSTVIVQAVQPHRIFVAHLFPHLLYVAANIYPAPWLLAPVSFFQGMALAIGWNAMSTYLTLLAAGEAKMKDKNYSVVSGKYFGIFGLFFQIYFVVGNLIASLVLTYANSPPPSSETNQDFNSGNILAQNISFDVNSTGNQSSNDELNICGANYWQHYDPGGAALYVSNETKYLLFGVYMMCVAVAIIISIVHIEPLNTKCFDRSVRTWTRIQKHSWAMAKIWVSPKFLLIAPLQMYSFMEVAFVTAEITKAFVTCPIGIHMVGWTMMFLGFCGSVSSYIGGHLTKCIGRTSQLFFAGICNIAVLAFMVYWKPTTDSYLPYFAILGLWGLSDGLWVAHINSLMNTVFPTKYEEAFSGLRMCQGIGVALVGGISGIFGMLVKVYMIGGFCIFAFILYLIHVIIYKPDYEEEKKVALMRQTSV